MPRPKTKEQLQFLSKHNFKKLMDFVDNLDVDTRMHEFIPGTMNRNIRDVFGHLHHWHLMMVHWYEVGMIGKKPEMPAKGHTWKTTPQLNREIWEIYRESTLEEVTILLVESYQSVQNIIDRHTDEELFEKKRYHWTGSTSLGSYLVSASSSHYDWALKLIKNGLKTLIPLYETSIFPHHFLFLGINEFFCSCTKETHHGRFG